MGSFLVDRRRDPEPERVRGFERVDDMQVMRPGFGEILPRVRGRVGRNEALRPIRRRAVLVVALQSFFIVLKSSPKTARHWSSLPPSRTSMSQ